MEIGERKAFAVGAMGAVAGATIMRVCESELRPVGIAIVTAIAK